MKNMFLKLALVAGLAFAVGTTAMAAEGKEKEVTIKGKGVCAKCELHQTKTCQNAIVAKKKNGQEVTYYLTGDKSKSFHKNICQEGKDVVAKGTVSKDADGKMTLNVTDIKLAKADKGEKEK